MFYKEVTVTERLVSASNNNSTSASNSRRQRVYSLVLEFIPTDELASHYSCTLDQVRQTVQTGFIAKMMSAIDKLLKLKTVKKTADSDEGSTIDLITVYQVHKADETRERRIRRKGHCS